eukprot:TRINITY_DN1610_c0_g1_i1.p1 TRINITY_DN1610_c0_g1~~TRINITY_DN1610_c0_g1_i1.p1  ORF type:complete len:656 (-),score=154.69 TRINITY_DN1610_c0_g1_i1:61-1932(-)
MGEHIQCGVDLCSVSDIVAANKKAKHAGYDFLVAPLAHPRYKRSFTKDIVRDEPWTRSDLLLSSYQWGGVVGKISPWIDLDSNDETIRTNSVKIFKQEVAWASHLSLPAVLLPTPSFNSPTFAQTVNQSLGGLSYMQLLVKIPLISPQLLLQKGDPSYDITTDSWEWWNGVRTHAEYSPNLLAALELTANLPSDRILRKWLGEPVRAVILSTDLFQTNRKGYPTLSKRHQDFIIQLFKRKVQFVISGSAKHPEGLLPYQQYLRYLNKHQPPLTEQESFEGPYLDYLQAPLQPLMDNLESQTYETFERDPIKYREYEAAVYLALKDYLAGSKKETKKIVLMVVGAGRGPLVKASIRAGKRAYASEAECLKYLKVYAVEKNANAVVTLQNLKASTWGDQVTVVNTDMRVWQASEKADILVSELLGSWGDNELSPECLDGAQKFLKNKKDDGEDGISIPCEYTSFVAPLSSSKLYNEVKSFGDKKHFETPYVVKFMNVDELAPAKDCFVFEHPRDLEVGDNTRYKKLEWTLDESSVLHGFSGYFDAKLYKDVHISINPETFSEGMFSWFPLFIPLRTPIYCPRGSRVEAHFWRCMSPTKVWYEWSVAGPSISPIHNVNGRSYWIGL